MSPHPYPSPLAIIIPTLNAAQTLENTLQTHQYLNASEIIVVDGGSHDNTLQIAQKYSTRLLSTSKGNRGQQLAYGASQTHSPWLLFQHADTTISPHACQCVHTYIAQPQNIHYAAYFQFRLNDTPYIARLLEYYVALRNHLFALPYGDQGLLISRYLYDTIGGYQPLPLMEDVHIIQKLGKKRLQRLNATATTSPQKYKKDGYILRGLRNLLCLLLYQLGVQPKHLLNIYHSK